jgi:hypothetical protein
LRKLENIDESATNRLKKDLESNLITQIFEMEQNEEDSCPEDISAKDLKTRI